MSTHDRNLDREKPETKAKLAKLEKIVVLAEADSGDHEAVNVSIILSRLFCRSFLAWYVFSSFFSVEAVTFSIFMRITVNADYILG